MTEAGVAKEEAFDEEIDLRLMGVYGVEYDVKGVYGEWS